MEYRISDLLDDIPEMNIDIQPKASASSKRIKELTMKKIHAENKKTHRGLGAIGKAILIAAMIAALAIPVAAAGGFQITGWLEGIFNPPSSEYNDDQLLGSVSKNWEVSGWVVNLAATDASAEGLTLTCEQWDNEAVQKSGSLNVDDSFWLETYQDGSYVKLPEKEIPAGELVPVKADAITEYPISWADSYGSLEPGSYRIGKNFTYIAEDGKQEIVPLYAKFRVFDQDMGSVVKEHQEMLETLRTSDSYHLAETRYYEGDDEFEFDWVTDTYWKFGEDWLEETCAYREDGSLFSRKGVVYRDGKGYSLEWSGDSVTSPLSAYTSIDYLDDMNRDMWAGSFELIDSRVGQVTGMDNSTTFLMYYSEIKDFEYFTVTMTADEQGKLASAYSGWVSDTEFTKEEITTRKELEVFDTPADEIAKIINAQNVTDPVPFSWAEDQAKYPDGKNSDFVNTTAKPIGSGEEAIERAKNECVIEYQNKASAAYDKDAQMWRVDLSYSQDSARHQLVYLTADGITKLVVLPEGE